MLHIYYSVQYIIMPVHSADGYVSALTWSDYKIIYKSRSVAGSASTTFSSIRHHHSHLVVPFTTIAFCCITLRHEERDRQPLVVVKKCDYSGRRMNQCIMLAYGQLVIIKWIIISYYYNMDLFPFLLSYYGCWVI